MHTERPIGRFANGKRTPAARRSRAVVGREISMREVYFVLLAALILAGCPLQCGCDKLSSSPAMNIDVATKLALEVPDGQAAKLTKENQVRIKEGMTLEEVSEILGPGLSVHDVQKDSVYEVGWLHKSSKKAIWVKFHGYKVTGTSCSNIE